jgi:hypothetical protein
MTEQHSDFTQRSSVTQATLFAIPIGVAVLSLFILFQRSGVLDLGFEGGMTPVTALLIGVVASFSSCLAVVGGLVLSLAAKLSQDGTPAVRPFFFFHMGRLGGFAFLGGALGFVGQLILALDEAVLFFFRKNLAFLL